MIPVCKDTEENGDTSLWFYNQGAYSRHDSKGNLKGQITGKNVPNPVEVWKARCEALGGVFPCESVPHPGTGQIVRLKPTEAAFKLFEHWQGVQADAQSND